jgi:hypothetical protein
VPLLVGLLVAVPLGAEELGAARSQALERAATLVAARGDADLTAAYQRLREAGVLAQLLAAYDEARAHAEAPPEGDGRGGFADPEVEARVFAAMRRHFREQGVLQGEDAAAEGLRFTVLRPSEESPGWFHCEAEVGVGGANPFFECLLVNPETGAVEGEACG